jgi:hypothetical protein
VYVGFSILGAHLKEGQLGHASQGWQQATNIYCAAVVVFVQNAKVAQLGEACKHFALWPSYFLKAGRPIAVVHVPSMLPGICNEQQWCTDVSTANKCVSTANKCAFTQL